MRSQEGDCPVSVALDVAVSDSGHSARCRLPTKLNDWRGSAASLRSVDELTFEQPLKARPESIGLLPQVGVSPARPVASGRIESLNVGSAGRRGSAHDPGFSTRRKQWLKAVGHSTASADAVACARLSSTEPFLGTASSVKHDDSITTSTRWRPIPQRRWSREPLPDLNRGRATQAANA